MEDVGVVPAVDPGVDPVVGLDVTVISKAGSAAVMVLLDAVIWTPVLTPTSALVGVPDSVPVPLSKEAHEGLPAIRKVTADAADTEGRNVYAWPTPTIVGGVPEIRLGWRVLVLPVVVDELLVCAGLEMPAAVLAVLAGLAVLAVLAVLTVLASLPPQPAKPSSTTATTQHAPIDFLILTPEPIPNKRSSGAKSANGCITAYCVVTYGISSSRQPRCPRP